MVVAPLLTLALVLSLVRKRFQSGLVDKRPFVHDIPLVVCRNDTCHQLLDTIREHRHCDEGDVLI